MKEGWKSVQIEDVAKIVNGGTPKTKVADYWGGEHVWITPAEMGRLQSPYLSNSRRKLSDAGLQHSSATLVPPHSVVLSTRAPIGHLIINSVPMAFNQGCRGIVPSENIHHKYLYYFLSFSVDLLNELGSGTTFKELAAGKLKKVEIPLPPLHEQKRIVAILDEALAGIATAVANTEKNLANARELFESYLNSVFSQRGEGWRVARLGDEIDLLTGFAFKSKGYTSSPNGVALLRGDNIVPRSFRWENVKRWPADNANEHEKYRLEKHDVVVAMDRTWIQAGVKYAQITKDDLPCLLVQRVARLRAGPNLRAAFLKYVIGSRQFTDYVLSIQTGVGVPHISGPQISNFEFPLPPIAMQDKFASDLGSLLAETSGLECIYQQKVTALAVLKQSLLQKAFSGELTASKKVTRHYEVTCPSSRYVD